MCRKEWHRRVKSDREGEGEGLPCEAAEVERERVSCGESESVSFDGEESESVSFEGEETGVFLGERDVRSACEERGDVERKGSDL